MCLAQLLEPSHICFKKIAQITNDDIHQNTGQILNIDEPEKLVPFLLYLDELEQCSVLNT